MSRVVTVAGAIPPESLGITDAHNHVWIDPVPCIARNSPVLNQREEILAELKKYVRAGGRTIIDCQPAGCGRNANELALLSKESGVNLVACTGFHRRVYYSPGYWLWGAQVEEIARHFIEEVLTGMHETLKAQTPVKAGLIKIACEESLQKTHRPALEAAAIAAVETGLAMEIHTEKGADVENIARFFLERGVKAGQIVLCHIDKRPDPGLHFELAQAGIYLEYDTFYRPKYQPEKFLWNLIVQMVTAGLHKQVVLATDMAESAMWVTPGLANYPHSIRQQLLEKDLGSEYVNDLMGMNIGRCLAQI